MIPNNIITEILSTVNIQKVIEPYVQLKQAGVNLKGNCPFHDEKTASFIVSPSKGIYKCFGCGKSGNAISFLMEHKNLSFPAAAKELAKGLNIHVPERKRTDEEKAEDKLRSDILTVNKWAMQYFERQLKLNDKATDYIASRFTQEEYQQHNIGYANADFQGLINEAMQAGYSMELLQKAELITKKKEKSFDYFIDRIIFPVISISGDVLGFTGRQLKENKFGKYLNSRANAAFDKSKILYGVDTAIKEIKTTKHLYLVEGNTDVMRMQATGYTNTVAAMGTAFNVEHAKAIMRIAKRVTIIMDGDSAGREATKRTGEILLRAGLFVQVVALPEEQDPDSWFKEDQQLWLKGNSKDFIFFASEQAFQFIANDPTLKVEAAYEVGKMLSYIDDEEIRDSYISDLVSKLKKHKVNKKLLEAAIRKFRKSDDAEESMERDSESLPTYLSKQDKMDYFKYGFYEGMKGQDLNQYFFGPGKKRSNFIIQPIFHIRSVLNSRKLFELINKYDHSAKIDIDMTEMTSLSAFRKVVEGQGNFVFTGNDIDFMKIRIKLYDNTVFCDNIDNLGWQPQGFWAWANGIQTESEFISIDDNGVVQHKDKNYYIPAYSSIYIHDKSLFTEERKFKLIKPEITIQQWSKMFVRVFGDNGKIGIAFWTATIFRDFILRIFKNFPLLNLFGPKGTGKSQMAMSMMNLFGEAQTTVNIHNVTKPGLADHISRFVNGFAWIDEYKNNMDFERIETLKSIYDSIGRSRMNMDKGKKKETTQVNSAVILSGQEMPTADIALFSRVIFVMFAKSEYNNDDKQAYDKLKAIERDGLSDFTNQIIQQRSYFEKEFYYNYNAVMTDLDNAIEEDVEDRIMRNWATIIASYKTVTDKIKLPFSYADILEVSIKGIQTQAKQVNRSDEIGVFWEIFESLFDLDSIIGGWHFKVDFTDSITTKSRTKTFTPARQILKFKFTSLAKAYSEHARRMGIKPLPHDTLRFYLENHKHFVGVSKKERFKLVEFSKEEGRDITRSSNTTAYCFLYDELNINLMRDNDEFVQPKFNQGKAVDTTVPPITEEVPY